MPSNPDNRPLTDQYAQDWHYERVHPRALPLPAPGTDIHDTPVYCMRVNEQWLPHVIGQLETLTQHRSWTGTETQRSDAIRQIEKLIAELTQPCILIGETMLRQNPDNPCLLEQSQDGGMSWTPAFDFDLCRDDSGGTTINLMLYQTQIDNFVQNNLNTWNQNQTVNNFAPTLVYDSSGADLNRDLAICYAARLVVAIILEASAENVQNGLGSSLSGFALTVFGAIAGAAAGLLTGNPIIGAAVGAIVSSEAAKVVFQAAAQLEIALIDDYVDDMGCMIYNALKGDTPDQTVFEHAVDTYIHDIPREIVRPFLADLDVWLTFLKLAVEAFELQEYGLPVPCPCIVYDWIYVSDFAAGPDGWGSAEDFEPTCLYRDAVHNPTGYWEWTVGMRNAFMVIHPMLDGTTIKEITIDWELSGFNGGEGMVYNNYDPAGCTPNEAVSAYQDWQQNGRNIRTLAVDYTFTSDAQYLGWNVDVDPTDANIKLYSIRIKGTGPNPFAVGGPIDP